jgi:pimeloyl-ACP methyl ester carboxylesterase
MPTVRAGDIDVYYETQGSGDPLVLIPYLALDQACYAFQVADYAKHFTCISVDLRGAGQTSKPEGSYTTELFADDVATFMHAIGGGACPCLGAVAGRRGGDVAGGQVSGEGEDAVAAQCLVEDRSVPADRCRGLAGDGQGGQRDGDGHPGHFPVVLHAGAVRS